MIKPIINFGTTCRRLRSWLFCDVARRRSVVRVRRFGTTYLSHLQWSSGPRKIVFVVLGIWRCNRYGPETPVTYRTPRNVSEEWRPHLHSLGSLKSGCNLFPVMFIIPQSVRLKRSQQQKFEPMYFKCSCNMKCVRRIDQEWDPRRMWPTWGGEQKMRNSGGKDYLKNIGVDNRILFKQRLQNVWTGTAQKRLRIKPMTGFSAHGKQPLCSIRTD
jgi:hypothetical protein